MILYFNLLVVYHVLIDLDLVLVLGLIYNINSYYLN
mgnify:CR=1 FL=1